MYENQWLGYALVPAAVIPLFVTAAIRIHARRMHVFCGILYAAMLAIHPAWWEDAFGGDCGFGRRALALIFIGIAMAILQFTFFLRAKHSALGAFDHRVFVLRMIASTFLTAAYVLIASKLIGSGTSGNDWLQLGIGWGIGIMLSLLLELVPATRLRYRRRSPGMCDGCGYDLRGSPGPSCPECGAPIKSLGLADIR